MEELFVSNKVELSPSNDISAGPAQRLHQPLNRFGAAVSARPSRLFWVIALYGFIACGLALHFCSHLSFLRTTVVNSGNRTFLHVVFDGSVIWASLGVFLMVFRTVAWILYRPVASASTGEVLDLTVVIPAYNEGPMVLKSIESVVAAHYPAEKLEIIVVDDGSRDDTWLHIQQAAVRYPQLLTAIRFPKNRGKREALAAGFERARGKVIVTLDSDSVIEPDALLAISGPFRKANVGAVAGKVAVFNRGQGLIPKMLHIRYLLTFDVLRAVESSYGTVYCCPGALTAYRTDAVRQVLPHWINQSFLGSRCTFGEDRALTNDLLASGYDTVYQGSAVVRTIVPVNYSGLCKMFLRWNRSYVREELRLIRIACKRPVASRLLTLYDRIVTNLQFPIGYGALGFLVAAFVTHPFLSLHFILTLLLLSTLSTAYVLRSEASLGSISYGVLFSLFSTVAMSWILPYAFLTVRARSWLTR